MVTRIRGGGSSTDGYRYFSVSVAFLGGLILQTQLHALQMQLVYFASLCAEACGTTKFGLCLELYQFERLEFRRCNFSVSVILSKRSSHGTVPSTNHAFSLIACSPSLWL